MAVLLIPRIWQVRLLKLLKALAVVIVAVGLVLLAWILAGLSFEYYPGE